MTVCWRGHPPESYLISPSGFVMAKIVGQVRADFLDRLLLQAKARLQ